MLNLSNYKSKYMKYKNKYTQIKLNQKGGVAKKYDSAVDEFIEKVAQNMDEKIIAMMATGIKEMIKNAKELDGKQISKPMALHPFAKDTKVMEMDNKTFIKMFMSTGVNTSVQYMMEHALKKSEDYDEYFTEYNSKITDEKTRATMWGIFLGPLEITSQQHVYITIDINAVQVMFITKRGYYRFTVFKPEINLIVQDAMEYPDPDLSYSYLGKIKSTVKYEVMQMDLKELLDNGIGMKETIQYMYNYYSQTVTPFIAVLGKARFFKKEQHKAAKRLTFDVLSNLLFKHCNLEFINGGYKGKLTSNAYGITRSGFEIPKVLEKPSVVIMCKTGKFDSHENPDVIGLYGNHWGDDTPALSFLADAAVFIAPYGAWTDIELVNFLYRNKACAIYYSRMYNNVSLGYGAGDINSIKKLESNLDEFKGERSDIPKNCTGIWIPPFTIHERTFIPAFTDPGAMVNYILSHPNFPSSIDITNKAKLIFEAANKIGFKLESRYREINTEFNEIFNSDTGKWDIIRNESHTEGVIIDDFNKKKL